MTDRTLTGSPADSRRSAVKRDRYQSATAAAVLLVAGIAAVVSYVHIEHLAVTHGQDGVAAALLPLSIDGTVIAASMTMLRAARAGTGTPGLARTMLALAVLATLACNVLYGLPHGITGALISGWPAIAFIGCAEMAIGAIRRIAAPARTVRAHPDRLATVTAPAPALGEGAHPYSARTRDRVRARTPVRPSASTGAVSTADAEVHYAAELAAGALPSKRRIKSELHVGQDRAAAIHDHLTAAAASTAPVSIS